VALSTGAGQVPRSWEAFQTRGDVFEALERYGAAVADYEKAVELYPIDSDGHYTLGQLYDTVGQHEKAVETLQRGIALVDGHVHFAWYHTIGQAYEHMHNYRIALTYFEKAKESFEKADKTIAPSSIEEAITRCRLRLRE
jgi:tetratricopeptide (TPR) repeat protein